MLRKDGSVFSLKPQPDPGELGMLRKVILKLSLEPQPDSGEMGMLRKAIFVLSPKPQPDAARLRNLRTPRSLQGPEQHTAHAAAEAVAARGACKCTLHRWNSAYR